MRRTLQTTEASLAWVVEKGVPVQIRGEWQGTLSPNADLHSWTTAQHDQLTLYSLRSHIDIENSDKPCDTGTPISTISKEFPKLSFSTVFPEYPAKTGRWAFSDAAIIQRGKDCRQWLKNRAEKVIAIVSHSGFLRVGVSHINYENADYRVFNFANDGSDVLVEWQLTRDNNGGMGRSGNKPIGHCAVTESEKGPGEVVEEKLSSGSLHS